MIRQRSVMVDFALGVCLSFKSHRTLRARRNSSALRLSLLLPLLLLLLPPLLLLLLPGLKGDIGAEYDKYEEEDRSGDIGEEGDVGARSLPLPPLVALARSRSKAFTFFEAAVLPSRSKRRCSPRCDNSRCNSDTFQSEKM